MNQLLYSFSSGTCINKYLYMLHVCSGAYEFCDYSVMILVLFTACYDVYLKKVRMSILSMETMSSNI